MIKENLKNQIFFKKGKLRREIIKRLDKPKTAVELAKILHKHRSSVSRTLLELEKKGFVRCINSIDMSFRYYELTKKGKIFLKR